MGIDAGNTVGNSHRSADHEYHRGLRAPCVTLEINPSHRRGWNSSTPPNPLDPRAIQTYVF